MNFLRRTVFCIATKPCLSSFARLLSMGVNLHPVWVVYSYSFMARLVMERLERRMVVVYVKRPMQLPLVVVRDKVVQTVVPPISVSSVLCNLSSLLLVWGWCGLEFIRCMSRSRNSLSKTVGVRAPFDVPLRTPTKQNPLSDRMDAGVPNARVAYLSTFTAFRPVASLSTPYPVMHREASSKYVIRFRSLTQKSFMACQSVCHMVLEYCRSNLTHLHFFAFAGHDFTSLCSFIMLYTVRPLMFLSVNVLVTCPTPEQPPLHSANTISISSSDIVLMAGLPPLLIVDSEPVLLYLAQRCRICRGLIFMLSAIVALGLPSPSHE